MPEERHPDYHPPQAPSQDSVNEHKDEGEGPFGSDMTSLLGGTRPPGDNLPEATQEGNIYSTGTSPADGRSVTPSAPQAHFDHTAKSSDADTDPQ
ncbi:hypothetical protein [Deinococcus petrolearius]|uniref:Uncharacterized protein n=1 Tax=Deinococcus petrolearius TaxID=1751295 RepID=A0ABW1DNI2_9DEIO